MFNYNWISLAGRFEKDDNCITYKGDVFQSIDGSAQSKVGNYLSNQYFQEGKIKAQIEFLDVSEYISCDIMFYHSYVDGQIELASIGINKSPAGAYELKSYKEGKFSYHQTAGDPNALEANKIYDLELEYRGSRAVLKVDGVQVINASLPFSTHNSQVGLWTNSKSDIKIHSYVIEKVEPSAFVVMQFTAQYNELYDDVIKPVCEEFNYEVIRADDIYSNGMIINDITKSIIESKVIIADITPKNPNVYYEVGYAHALSKNTILLAEEGCELPFDVRPYRVIMYKNTISGKKLVEEKLRMHLNNII